MTVPSRHEQSFMVMTATIGMKWFDRFLLCTWVKVAQTTLGFTKFTKDALLTFTMFPSELLKKSNFLKNGIVVLVYARDPLEDSHFCCASVQEPIRKTDSRSLFNIEYLTDSRSLFNIEYLTDSHSLFNIEYLNCQPFTV